MNRDECLERLDLLSNFMEMDSPPTVENVEVLGAGLYAVYGKVALPCLPTGRFGMDGIESEGVILDIPIDLEGETIGHLCLSSKLDQSGIDISAVTDAQKHAIVKLSSASDFDTGSPAMMRLEYDCVVIDRSQVEQFLQSRRTSALWGGFVLELDKIPLERHVARAGSSRIKIGDLTSPRTLRHSAALQRATESPVPVDRFLHLYHFLELDYDHEIVKRISQVDPENTRGLEKLLVTGRAELDRLHLLCEDFSDLDELERIAGVLKDHAETALSVFYDYGKDHNPLKSSEAFKFQFLEAPVINRHTLDEIKKSNALDSTFARNDTSYREMLIKLACYWVYRIRCCVAHNKLGEYHLWTASDMRFVGEFGEPLIMALIMHRLKHPVASEAESEPSAQTCIV